jgi:hypothetical protein
LSLRSDVKISTGILSLSGWCNCVAVRNSAMLFVVRCNYKPVSAAVRKSAAASVTVSQTPKSCTLTLHPAAQPPKQLDTKPRTAKHLNCLPAVGVESHVPMNLEQREPHDFHTPNHQSPLPPYPTPCSNLTPSEHHFCSDSPGFEDHLNTLTHQRPWPPRPAPSSNPKPCEHTKSSEPQDPKHFHLTQCIN